ncbi:MAG: hypothetical protein Tsb0021_05100 [Chlamydiales bacterium]
MEAKAHNPYKWKVPLHSWGKAFNSSIIPSQNSILMGYSMGARLAIHALLDDPKRWKAAILIGANLGLTTLKEKICRLQNDKLWSRKFSTMSWKVLIEDWNNQSIFKNSTCLKRREEEFNREDLCFSLCYWSLGSQKNFKGELEQLNLPIFWIFGEHDKNSSKDIPKMKHSLSKKWIAQDAGHRVPWDVPNDFINNVNDFIKRVL